MRPEIVVGNRQRGVKLKLLRLRGLSGEAVGLCLGQLGQHAPVLPGLETVEISLVSDRTIARVHRQFMAVPGATDVITFPHGEIVVSATTAAREATERSEPLDREVMRYIVHGLLHLNGHEDAIEAEAAAMWRTQEEIVERLWPQRPGMASKR